MATYKFTLTNEEYAVLRMAAMKGKFVHDFEQVGSEVRVKTKTPHLLAEELEALIDSGETSWNEILGIDSH